MPVYIAAIYASVGQRLEFITISLIYNGNFFIYVHLIVQQCISEKNVRILK